MKFSVSKPELYSSLQRVIKVTPVRSTLPILSCVLFTVRGDELELRSTDLEISVITRCRINGEEDGSIAIPGRMLLDVTSELPNTDLRFQVDLEKDTVRISTSAGGEYTITGRPANEFPSSPQVDDNATFNIASQDMLRIIDKTVFAVSRDEMKLSLTGVLFQFKENEFRAVSTDGHRLVRYIKHDFENEDYLNDVIIPTKFLNLLNSNLKTDTEMTLRIGKNHVLASFSDMAVYSRIIQERFPDYESVIPRNNRHILKAEIDDFLAAVKRISIFSSKNTHQIVLKLSEASLSLSTEDLETNSNAHEDVAVSYEGEAFSISLNGEYLKDVLRHVDGDSIQVHMNSHLSATLFFPEEQQTGEDLLMLLMPIRVSN